MPFRFNPWAQPFNPSAPTNGESKEESQMVPAEQHQNRGHEDQHNTDAAAVAFLSLEDVPDEVLAIVASHLPTPSDLASFILTCKRFMEAMSQAHVAVWLSHKARLLNTEALDALVDAIVKYYKGAFELDVSGLALDDKQIQRLLIGLPRLAKLHLAGCRKITSALAPLLACSHSKSLQQQPKPRSSTKATTASAKPSSKLRVLNLQRCFQLNSQLLAALLASAAQPRAQLQLLAMSHVDLSHFPFRAPATGQSNQPSPVNPALVSELPAPNRFSSLRILALHNSTKLGPAGMQAIALCCPLLELLLLGGCTLPASCSTAGLDMPERYTTLAKALRALLPKGSTTTTTASGLSNTPISIGSNSTSSGQLVREFAVNLAAMAAQLPRLKALELTLFPPAIVFLVRTLLCAQKAGSQPLLVWDFSKVNSVYSALDLLATAQQPPAATRPAAVEVRQLALALQCAVNCSSASRITPLHCAAEQGDNAFAAGVLELGAGVNARDGGGATPLFLACEAGHAAVVNTLLDAGADALLRNAAGETPLYIAALRGHLQVIKSLVAHQDAHAIDWRDARLYGDHWTPLMAAAVANRLDVAKHLLAAASSSPLVGAVNRYGQTVLHIAARKGSSALLRLLLEHGAGRFALVADASGDTPVDIAVRNRHEVALGEFRRLGCAVGAAR